MAVLVLAAQGKIEYDQFVFANVGNDSENPATLRYLEEHARPFASQHGLKLVEVNKYRYGRVETIYKRLTRPESRSIPIPMKMSGNGAPGTRSCTSGFKVRVLARHMKKLYGIPNRSEEVIPTVGLGISTNEAHRAKSVREPELVCLGGKCRRGEAPDHIQGNFFEPAEDNEKPSGSWTQQWLEYPLLNAGMNVADCEALVTDAGLPVPPKSSCWFCPHHSLDTWRRMMVDEPEIFYAAANLEWLINHRRAKIGRDPFWLTSALVPLRDAIIGHYDEMFSEFENCESGYCGV